LASAPRSRICLRSASASYPLSPLTTSQSGKRSIRETAAVQSATLPPVIRNASGRQCSSVRA
jgi:hypothetical protein